MRAWRSALALSEDRQSRDQRETENSTEKPVPIMEVSEKTLVTGDLAPYYGRDDVWERAPAE